MLLTTLTASYWNDDVRWYSDRSNDDSTIKDDLLGNMNSCIYSTAYQYWGKSLSYLRMWGVWDAKVKLWLDKLHEFARSCMRQALAGDTLHICTWPLADWGPAIIVFWTQWYHYLSDHILVNRPSGFQKGFAAYSKVAGSREIATVGEGDSWIGAGKGKDSWNKLQDKCSGRSGSCIKRGEKLMMRRFGEIIVIIVIIAAVRAFMLQCERSIWR